MADINWGQLGDQMLGWGNAVSNGWKGFKQEHPLAGLALSIAPYTGTATALPEMYDAVQRKDPVDTGLAALQLIPFGGIVKGVRGAKETWSLAKTYENAMSQWGLRAADPLAAPVLQAIQANKAAAVGHAVNATGAGFNDAQNLVDYTKNK